MTAQEYYDLLVRTSVEGRFPSYHVETRQCLYRMSNGCRCAVGLILPESAFLYPIEGGTARDVVERICDDSWVPSGLSVQDLVEVQGCHDALAISTKGSWSHTQFVENLSHTHCFRNVNHVNA